mmetsp:Transcript_32858/g.29154  ORF Transcript_32858/g.29154 Transcript_32858/m.29154 type:complete len:82 (+) Transcript_32858:205-450(+)
MMEYKDNTNSPIKSHLGSIVSESLSIPSIAEESKPALIIPKTINNFETKPSTLSNNFKTMINKEIFHLSLETSAQKASNKP